MTTLISILGLLLVGALAIAGIVVGGMRAKWPPLMEAIRRLSRSMNSKQIETAGQPGADAAILRHVGRSSGTAYATPLAIEPTEDGFVIALVYGERTQWLKNVLAAGSAEVVKEGQTYPVDRPTVVPLAELDDYFGPNDRRVSSLIGVQDGLRLYHADHD